MIVYGYNNFIIKSYSPSEIGLPLEQGNEDIRFEVRQKYAHLFWIPFFPLSKMWVIKKPGDKNLYVMPDEIKRTVIAHMGKPGTPWYSFSLILLGVLVFMIFRISSIAEKKQWENDFYNNLEKTKMLIEYPTTGDCYVFYHYSDPGKYSSDKMILKVNKYSDDSIQFISLYDDLYKEAESNDSYNYHESFDIAGQNQFNPTLVDKETLKQALKQEYKGSRQPVKIEPLDGFYVLDKVDRRKLE
jgi:hypothetical protein